jgi:hypothetical protein
MGEGLVLVGHLQINSGLTSAASRIPPRYHHQPQPPSLVPLGDPSPEIPTKTAAPQHAIRVPCQDSGCCIPATHSVGVGTLPWRVRHSRRLGASKASKASKT